MECAVNVNIEMNFTLFPIFLYSYLKNVENILG